MKEKKEILPHSSCCHPAIWTIHRFQWTWFSLSNVLNFLSLIIQSHILFSFWRFIDSKENNYIWMLLKRSDNMIKRKKELLLIFVIILIQQEILVFEQNHVISLRLLYLQDKCHDKLLHMHLLQFSHQLIHLIRKKIKKKIVWYLLLISFVFRYFFSKNEKHFYLFSYLLEMNKQYRFFLQLQVEDLIQLIFLVQK